jgi:hypothetical protein
VYVQYLFSRVCFGSLVERGRERKGVGKTYVFPCRRVARICPSAENRGFSGSEATESPLSICRQSHSTSGIVSCIFAPTGVYLRYQSLSYFYGRKERWIKLLLC